MSGNVVAQSGAGVVTAAQLNAYVQSAATAATARAFVGIVGMQIMLAGVSAVGDGTGGMFYWSSGSYTDDNYSTLVPPAAAGQGAWLRAPIAGTAAASATQVFATGAVTSSSTLGAYNYGTLPYSDTGLLGQFTLTTNSYAQIIISNPSGTTVASADIIVSNDLGTATTNYGDFGINSSVFSGTGSLALAGAVYLYAASGDLVLGTSTSNAIHFVVNGGATDAGYITAAGSVVLGKASPSTTTTGVGTFLYVPVMAGAPTGAPVVITGLSPIVFDSTNNKIWLYINSAWKGVVVS